MEAGHSGLSREAGRVGHGAKCIMSQELGLYLTGDGESPMDLIYSNIHVLGSVDAFTLYFHGQQNCSSTKIPDNVGNKERSERKTSFLCCFGTPNFYLV